MSIQVFRPNIDVWYVQLTTRIESRVKNKVHESDFLDKIISVGLLLQ